jgi:hypothetical protein
MRQTAFKLLAALATFTLGVSAAAVFVFLFTRPEGLHEVAPPPAAVEAPAPTCFPGLSVGTGQLTFDHSYHFPDGAFHPLVPDAEGFAVRWYSKHLSAMGEPRLFEQPDVGETYRFLWLRSFQRPVAVRVSRDGERRTLFVKELHGAGGSAPGVVTLNLSRALSAAEWGEFVRLLEAACYWRMPAHDGLWGADGSQWILEGSREGRYHVVHRWTPRPGDFREACYYLLKISGVGVERMGSRVY